LRQVAFNFIQTELAPKADKIDKDDVFPEMREFWKKLGEFGFLGITADPDFGGTGGTYFDHCIIMEELSRASAAIALSYGAHSNLCVNQINRNGTDAQKSKYLPRVTPRFRIRMSNFFPLVFFDINKVFVNSTKWLMNPLANHWCPRV
jgi:isovaleryl-CoA dehydrogenase